ncbi:Unknown protein [Striga hermonthica]|uniref:Glabrous enhancer-binding protein-like DBD domain-containing protein n=1 Tax=Striga hermonthica TaxID=68872 RepID=A0A9N7MT06_STRHE|nr:Unknown protein [Striga hermonthica]
MAPKTQIPSKQKKPREPSSEEEEEDSEEQQSDSSSSGDEQVVAKSRGADQDIGSDSDSDSDLGDYRLQPVPKAPKSSKRGREETKKKEKTVEAAKNPGGCIIRLWSDDDEVTLLKGMIEFRDARGRDASADMAAFYGYIKGNLKFEPSRVQVRSKVNRLKNIFLNALKKSDSDNGEDPVFSNPHDHRLFELSKIVWGPSGRNSIQKGQNLDENVPKENENGLDKASGSVVHTKDARRREMMKSFLLGVELEGLDRRILEAANHMLEEEGGIGDEDEKKAWKKLKIEEIDVVLRHAEVKTKQIKHLQQLINS